MRFKRMFVDSVFTLTQRITIIGNIPRTKYLFELEAYFVFTMLCILSRCIFVPFYGNRD